MGRMTDMFEAQKDQQKQTPIYTLDDWRADRRRFLLKRQIFWTIVALMIIGLAAFYGQEEIKAIWRDVVDLVGGVK
jgi:hypothetical protein